MNLSDQVTSLELSRRLKELGVEHNSYFKYEVREFGWFEIYHSKATSCAHKYYPAYTVAELGEILRKFELETDRRLEIDYYHTYDGYNIVIKPMKVTGCNAIYTKSPKEADARAQTVIWLYESGYMKNE